MDTWNGDDAWCARIPRHNDGHSTGPKEYLRLNTIHNAVFLPAETYGHDYYPSNTEPTFKAGD